MTDYERIQKAIEFIQSNFQQQPDLDAVAKKVYLSPFHFQRLFKDWAHAIALDSLNVARERKTVLEEIGGKPSKWRRPAGKRPFR